MKKLFELYNGRLFGLLLLIIFGGSVYIYTELTKFYPEHESKFAGGLFALCFTCAFGPLIYSLLIKKKGK